MKANLSPPTFFYRTSSIILTITINKYTLCLSLTSVSIPNSVTSIEGFAFGYCSSLASITIPNSVEYIGGGAFACKSLRTIYSMSPTPPEACFDSFYSLDYCTPKDAVVYVPMGSKEAYSQATGWNYFSDFREMTNDVNELSSDSDARPKDIYNTQGTLVKANASQADIDALDPGLYIIGGRKVIVK